MATNTLRPRVTPVISTAIYASGDWLHDDMLAFNYGTPRVVSEKRLATIKAINVYDIDGEAADLDVLIFKHQDTFATDPVKNDAAAVDGDDIRDALIGQVQVEAADYIDLGVVQVARVECNIPLPSSGNKLFYAQAIVRATPTYTAATDVVIEFEVEWL